MTDEQRFIFDVQGYLVVEKVLSPERVARMCADMEEHGIREPDNNPNKSRFGGFLNWGEDWRNLVDEPKLLPILRELLGPCFRLDHAYGMAMRAEGEGGGEGLHHHAGMFHHGSYYVTHGNKMHNGLIVVSYALTDIEPGVGGFACIPGSHKALFPVPEKWYGVNDNPLVRQVPQKAGDALIFTEALTHGTMPWRDPNIERRSVLLKYCPHYMQWVPRLMPDNVEGLTARQKLIMQPPWVWDRPQVELERVELETVEPDVQ
jgi:ectoine hydroxylase-related dioxygenase (phytanoyl-CoA dioxygenase family)